MPALPPAARPPRLRRREAPPAPPCPPLGSPPGRLAQPAPDTGPRRVALPGPFTGDFKGATWNAQALFARAARRHLPKARDLRRLAAQHDFVTVTESHGAAGSSAIWDGPRDCQCWWSPGTARRAGVGAVVQRAFLELFNSAPPEWVEVSPGRAAVLRLRGPSGSLDIWAV